MKVRIQLDWSRLLGFDQVASEKRLDGSQLAKSGLKPVSGSGPEQTASLGHRVGAKIGSKPGLKPA